jgi:nitroreductase
MDVFEAVAKRYSARAFKPVLPPPGLVKRLLLEASRAPSGGNLQSWRVYALAGEPMARFKALVASSPMERPEYEVYPPNLWDPFRTRRFQCGEDLYASIEVPREDRAGRMRALMRNTQWFDAPVGIMICVDRKLGPPQWSDLGMYMQTFMLLAAEAGLDTCAQEFWASYPLTVAKFFELPEDHMVFSGIAVGYADETAPINGWRTRRDDFADWCEMRGFDE